MNACPNGHPQTVTAYCATVDGVCSRYGSWAYDPETGELYDISGEPS